LRFLAATALQSNLDSVFTVGHNVFIYLDPLSDKFVFIPWDLDLSFGGFFRYGSPDQLADLSLMRPYPGEFKLVDRLLAWNETRDRYRKVLQELSTSSFSKEKLLRDLDAVEKATRQIIIKETKAAQARKEEAVRVTFAFQRVPAPPLQTFIEKRTESVAAQLAGTSKGTIPATGFGGKGGGQPKKDGNP
jgi:spore coat protein CotH